MMAAVASVDPVCIVGRYALYDSIASGGMATVHYGRLRGPVGFARTVAIKRLHPELARDPEFVSMFLDEARLAARIRHPNVVQTVDVVAEDGELFLVMDYVQGESLARLLRQLSEENQRIPHRIVTSIMSGALMGLHAAHEAKDEQGARLGLVHRDVSPHNVLVGADGMSRVLDFGVAKAAGRVHTTREGKVKGKLAYMAPEQIQSGQVTREADIYSAGVVLWEALTGRRLFHADNQTTVLARILAGNVAAPSDTVPGLPKGYDAVVARGLARHPTDRFASAKEMALALEAVDGVESPATVAAWLETLAGSVLEARAEHVLSIERGSDISNISELQAALQSTESSSSRSGVVTVSANLNNKRKGPLIAIASALAALVVAGIVLLVVRNAGDDEVEVQAVPSEPAAVTETKPPPTEATLAAAATPAPAESADEAAPEASAPKTATKARAPAGTWRPPKSRASTATSKSEKKKSSPFDGLGGRL